MLGLISSWFTPTFLFIFLNLMIFTIVIISRFTKTQHDHQHQHQQLARAPSLLERVKSIDFSFYKFPSTDLSTYNFHHQPTEPEHHTDQVVEPLTRTPSLLERVKSISFSSLYTSDPPNPEPETHTEPHPDSSSDPDHHVKRSKSETKLGPRRVAEKTIIKKSASEKSVVEIDRTVSFGDGGGDHGVDAKADDFINRFKQQLKLQRLDSLLRYRGK